MIASETIPIVLPNGNEPGKCFYCNQEVGQPHKKHCVTIKAKVRYRVEARLPSGLVLRGTWETYDPWAWFQTGDPEVIDQSGLWDFARNEGSWCAENASDIKWEKDDADSLIDQARIQAGYNCRCAFMNFELDRVLDNRYHWDYN